jgi:hypothetical protein
MRSFVVLLWVALANDAFAQIADIDFQRDIKPILRERCTSCHGAIKQESNLRLDSYSMMVRGGDGGSALNAGNPDTSPVVQRIRAADPHYRMPPEGKPLTDEQVATIAKWIAAGAPAPKEDVPDQEPTQHWSFQTLSRPTLPELPASEPTVNPIDAFIIAKRLGQNLTHMPSADPGVLLRRVYLDLIGVPPTTDQLLEYLADPSEEAYRQTIDQLLASPLYGERWGRHWMDVWRYSDWYGRRSVPDVMNSYPMIWRWRDWIVRSLNEDKPYSQMVVEMLAADEVHPDDLQKLAATGFLVRSWFKWNYETWKKDLVEHTGKAFLGLTLNCCQCHDHKYDPISQEDYFRFRAFFEPLELRHERMPGEPDPGPFEKYVYAKSYGPIKSGMIRVFDEYLNSETFMFSKGDARLRMEGKPTMKASPPQFLAGSFAMESPTRLPITAAYPGMRAFIQAEERDRRRLELNQAESALADIASNAHQLPESTATTYELARREAAAQRVQAAHADLLCLENRIAADAARFATGNLDEDRKDDPSVQSMIRTAIQSQKYASIARAKFQVAAAEAEKIQATTQLEKVMPDDKKAREDAQKSLQSAAKKLAAANKSLEEATASLTQEAGEYAPLSPKYLATSTGRRSSLARWIVNNDNPLTARVAMNHVWLRHFGQAIVDSTHDFGLHGSLPSHPELLDWLACEFRDSGWSMKHMHRLILTSQTYRMASELPKKRSELLTLVQAAKSVDPENRWYWRFPTGRMQAEVVRDSLLWVAEELDTTMGGHEIDHQQGMKSHRRSLYFSHHGEEKMEFLELFDAANACDCYKRNSSVQPQQALALANSELTQRLSRSLAMRIRDRISSSESSNSFARMAFLQILGREPSSPELTASTEFLARQEKQYAELRPVDAQKEFEPSSRARANLIHVLMNHNDFVTVR